MLLSVKAAELNTGSDDRRHRQNQTLGKSHIYVYSIIAPIRDAGSLAKHCLIMGRMPYFALAWHIEELSDILLQVGVTIIAYGRRLSLQSLLSLFLNPLRNLPHVYRDLQMVRG